MLAIANDITMGAGAFGPKEYVMFAAATEYGLAHRLPILYLAANSGARFGLAQEVQKHIQVRASGTNAVSHAVHILQFMPLKCN